MTDCGWGDITGVAGVRIRRNCQEKVDEQSLARLLTLSARSGSLSQANMALLKYGETDTLLNFLLF